MILNNTNNDINGKITLAANSGETIKHLMIRFTALIDESKLTPRCCLKWNTLNVAPINGNTFYVKLLFSGAEIAFTGSFISGTTNNIIEPIFDPDNTSNCRFVYLSGSSRTELDSGSATGSSIEMMY